MASTITKKTGLLAATAAALAVAGIFGVFVIPVLATVPVNLFSLALGCQRFLPSASAAKPTLQDKKPHDYPVLPPVP